MPASPFHQVTVQGLLVVLGVHEQVAVVDRVLVVVGVEVDPQRDPDAEVEAHVVDLSDMAFGSGKVLGSNVRLP